MLGVADLGTPVGPAWEPPGLGVQLQATHRHSTLAREGLCGGRCAEEMKSEFSRQESRRETRGAGVCPVSGTAAAGGPGDWLTRTGGHQAAHVEFIPRE